MKLRSLIESASLCLILLSFITTIFIYQGTNIKDSLKIKRVSAEVGGGYQKLTYNCSCSYAAPAGCDGTAIKADCLGSFGNPCGGVYTAWDCKMIFAVPCPGPGGMTEHSCKAE
jgi:hypothetical protein